MKPVFSMNGPQFLALYIFAKDQLLLVFDGALMVLKFAAYLKVVLIVDDIAKRLHNPSYFRIDLKDVGLGLDPAHQDDKQLGKTF